ncbi:MAG: YhcH/YjgK/YiaL family protein [Kiritimatiellae bacterium]|nr:YhcH/YjgK/YiaL family protein [Kiritimatiellia bacterium]
MIVAKLEDCGRFLHLHPGFAAAFRFLQEEELAALPAGRRELVADKLYVNVDHVDGRRREGAVLEIHKKFIDIQYTVSGAEVMGWRDFASCANWREPFDETRDIGFLNDQPFSWFSVPPGYFAIFFPEDAHAPLAGRGRCAK